jgi:hypothetical protein
MAGIRRSVRTYPGTSEPIASRNADGSLKQSHSNPEARNRKAVESSIPWSSSIT